MLCTINVAKLLYVSHHAIINFGDKSVFLSLFIYCNKNVYSGLDTIITEENPIIKDGKNQSSSDIYHQHWKFFARSALHHWARESFLTDFEGRCDILME